MKLLWASCLSVALLGVIVHAGLFADNNGDEFENAMCRHENTQITLGVNNGFVLSSYFSFFSSPCSATFRCSDSRRHFIRYSLESSRGKFGVAIQHGAACYRPIVGDDSTSWDCVSGVNVLRSTAAQIGLSKRAGVCIRQHMERDPAWGADSGVFFD